MRRKKILLLTKNYHQPFPLESPLRLAGYQVDCRQEIEDAIRQCQLAANAAQNFDLLIADVDSDQHAQLEELQQLKIVERLLLLREPPTCPEMYCVHGKVACLCLPSALLAVVKELFESSASAGEKCESKCNKAGPNNKRQSNQ